MIDESDDDIERLLAAATPRRAPGELRAAIIAAVVTELEPRRATAKPTWQSWVERAVAASVLCSAATFLGVTSFEARRMARWDERPAVRADVAELTVAIASVTDDRSARAVERYLISLLPTRVKLASVTMRPDLQEIQRWTTDETIAERRQSDAKTQERI